VTPTTATKPLEVDLLICPKCRKPSRIDATAFRGTKGAAYCMGPISDGHRKVRCVPVRFVEVVG
jgi:hypothetical protein